MERNNRFVFTKRRVERLKPESKRLSYYDRKCPGLELRVSPIGGKVFYVLGKNGHRKRLGPFPVIDVKLARIMAMTARADMEQGIRAVQRERLGDAWQAYRQDLTDRECTPRSVQSAHDCYKDLEKWSNRYLVEIAVEMVLKLKRDVREKSGKSTSNNVVGLLRAIFNFAIKRGFEGDNPASELGEYRIESRTRFVEPHELWGFITSLEDRGDVLGDVCLAGLFTGVRRASLFTARWADVDFERKRWSFVAKGNIKCAVYFSDYVEALFRRRRAEVPEEQECVFYNPLTGSEVSNWGHPLWKAEMAARRLPRETPYKSIPHEIVFHTLRHTFITYALRAKISLPTVQKMVGHTLGERSATMRIYAHSGEAWEREGFQTVANLILETARKWKPQEVAIGQTVEQDVDVEAVFLRSQR